MMLLIAHSLYGKSTGSPPEAISGRRSSS